MLTKTLARNEASLPERLSWPPRRVGQPHPPPGHAPRACCRISHSWCCIPSRSQGAARWMCLRISRAWWRKAEQCWRRSCSGIHPGRPGQPCTVIMPATGAVGVSAGWAIPSDKGATINAPTSSSRPILWWIMAYLDLLDPMVTRRTISSVKAFHMPLPVPSRARRVNDMACVDRWRAELFDSAAIIARWRCDRGFVTVATRAPGS